MVISQALYLVFLALVACERGAELVISRAHARVAFANGAYEVGRGHYRLMASVHTLFFASCAAEVLLLDRSFPGALGFVALAAALLAQGLRYSAVSALGQRWNVRIIVWPNAAPVTSGPYRFIRHPNYLAVCIELFFIPLIHGAVITAWVFTALNAGILAVRIGEEERALGNAYREVFRGRPRFLPRVFGG
jgi:methyltransferase